MPEVSDRVSGGEGDRDTPRAATARDTLPSSQPCAPHGSPPPPEEAWETHRHPGNSCRGGNDTAVLVPLSLPGSPVSTKGPRCCPLHPPSQPASQAPGPRPGSTPAPHFCKPLTKAEIGGGRQQLLPPGSPGRLPTQEPHPLPSRDPQLPPPLSHGTGEHSAHGTHTGTAPTAFHGPPPGPSSARRARCSVRTVTAPTGHRGAAGSQSQPTGRASGAPTAEQGGLRCLQGAGCVPDERGRGGTRTAARRCRLRGQGCCTPGSAGRSQADGVGTPGKCPCPQA